MALMTATQIQTLTDHVAAMIRDELAGVNNAALCPVGGGLWNIVDSIDNADIQIALAPAADNVDVLSFNQSTLMKNYIATKYAAFLLSLQTQIRADGTYATLDAYLTGVGAQVSPYIQSIISNSLGANLSPVNVFPPAVTASSFDAVFAGVDGSLVNLTSAAGNTTTADVALFAANGNALYLGMNSLPAGTTDAITIDLGTDASVSVGLVVQYWNGTGWVAVTTHDADTTGTYANAGTLGLTKSGTILYNVPANWERVNQDNSGAAFPSDKTPRFYLRLTRTAATVATTPIANMLQRGTGNGLIVITGANTAVLIAGTGINTTLYDATNTLSLRALSATGAAVTPTITYTNRAGTVAQTQSLGAFASPTLGATFSPSAITAGVASVTGVTVSTTATTGVIAIENTPLRVESK